MDNKWLYNIRHISPGEAVKADVVGRPDRALEERTSYLKDRLDAADAGRALFDVDVTIAPDVLEGQPVFWNAQTQRYERAFAAVETDPITGGLITSPSSDCVGLLYAKKSSNLGDVVLHGIVKLPSITNAAGMTVKPGRYYLSATEAGKLVQQKPPVAVIVCHVQGVKDNCADDPWVVVMPQVRDFLEEHIHYRFELETTAAGIISTSGGRLVITDPDSTAIGWLPANHAIFNGKAPPGAVFGYNIGAHVALSRVWPPQPLQAVAMLWDKGEQLVGATEIPLGRDGLAVCDNNGIWWMSNCDGDVPWVKDLTPVVLSSSSSGSSSSAAPTVECPRDEKMRVIVVYLRMVFGNDRSVVTSLQPATGSPITITNCDDLPAKTGDLKLGLDLNLNVIPPNVSGAKVLKRIEDGIHIRAGLVTEGLVSASNSIVLRSVSEETTSKRALTTAEKTALGFDPGANVQAYQGLVKITFDDALAEKELGPQIIRLADAVERLYLDVPYIGFPAGQDALVRMRFIVPCAGLGVGVKMRIRAQIFGRADGTLPALTLTHRILSRPNPDPLPLPTADISPSPAFITDITVDADTAIEVDSADFSVSEGDTVLITIQRPWSGTSDGYAGEVGLLRLAGILTTD